MKKSLAMLFAMFMLGACSLTDDEGGAALDEAVSDALKQVETSTSGMTQWRVTFTQEMGSMTCKSTGDLYLSDDSFVEVGVTLYDGTMGGMSYDNEIVCKYASEGNFSKITEGFTVENGDGDTFSDLEGYTTLYKLETTSSKWWSNESSNGWEAEEDPGTSYYLAKEDGNKLHLVTVYNESGTTFTFYGETLSDAAGTYTKK